MAMADKVVCYRNGAYSDTAKTGREFQSGRAQMKVSRKPKPDKTKKEKGGRLTLFSNQTGTQKAP